MKTQNILAFTASALLMVACYEDDYQAVANKGDALQLRAEISQQYTTRANDGGFTDGDQIGVFIVNYADGQPQALQPKGNHADNVRFTYSEADGTWTGSYQLYWKDKQTPIDAYGYYPFDATLSSTEAYPFSVEKNQRDQLTTGRRLTGYEQSDLLWAKKEGVVPTEGTITLRHQHLMAGIKIVLTEGEGFEAGEWDRIEKTVIVGSTRTGSTVNLQTGTVSVLSGSTAEPIIPIFKDNEARAVVVPQTVAADATLFSFTIDGISLEYARTAAMTYQQGKQHQFTFAVNKSLPVGDYQLQLVSENITPWENDPLSHNGEAREYTVVHVNEGEFLGDVIDSLGLDPSKIINLKITGYLGKIKGYDEWRGEETYGSGDRHFGYIRMHMTNLEALNLKEVVKFNGPASNNALSWRQVVGEDYDGSWNPYEQGVDNYDGCLPYGAFENMKTLKYFTWPDSLEAIGGMAFPGSGITGSVILPKGLKFIGRDAFVAYNHKASSPTGELYIPETVEYIGDNAFGSYDGAKLFYFTNELVLPSTMKYLGRGAFEGCGWMTGSIHVPDGITEFNNAWPDQIGGPCIIPQGVKRINGIPRGANYLEIPEGVETISSYSSYGGSKLATSLRLPSTLKTIERNAFEGSKITHINLPEGIDIIEDWTFAFCENLQDTITIPSTVTQIREGAFADCRQLTAVILPAGLQGIQSDAFRSCFSLDYIECLGSEPPAIEENTFSGVEKNNFTVVVPEGAVEAYKNAPHWKEFKRISAYRNFVCRPMRAKLLNKSNVRDVVINANDSWAVEDCPSWIHVSPSSGFKKTELKITIDAMPHNQGDRQGAVTFKLGRNDEDGEPITCTYTVEQFDYEYEEDGVASMQKATKGQRGGIDILFVGDGYDAEDIARGTYLSDMQQEMEYFFGVEPYKTYRQYFNVSAAMAMSYESGVVDSPDKWRETKFSVTWGSGNNGRLRVPFDDIATYVLTEVDQCPVTTANVGRSLIICVPNSNGYEGLTTMYSDGSAIAICPMSKLDYPYDARGLIQHEAGGHGWAKLDDEYIYHADNIYECTCSDCTHAEQVEMFHFLGWGRNVSLEHKLSAVEWSHLTRHPNYYDIVDVYEGAHMHGKGIFRSEVNSVMNNNVPYFSTWSRQLIVERIFEAAGETFSLDNFYANDSREWGDKFLLTRSGDMANMKAVHSEHHAPIIKKGAITDYIKKGGNK